MHPTAPHPARGRQILLIAGSGRSGTSLCSGLAVCLGWHIPQPEVAANETNPRGFGEPRWAVDFHKQLLRSVQVQVSDGRPEAWQRCAAVAERPRARARLAEWLEEHFAESGRIVIKDPRVGWFLDLYRLAGIDTGAELRVVTMLRDPAENVRSRELAYGSDVTHTTRIVGWLNVMLGIEARTRDLPRAMLRYDDLLTDWRSALDEADRSLGLGLVSAASDEQLAEADALVDPSLRRSRSDWDELGIPRRLADLTRRTYRALEGLVGSPSADHRDLRAQLDDLTAEFRTYFDECAEVSRSRVDATRAEERRRAARRRRRQQHEAVRSSRTGPLAAVRREVRGLVGRARR